MVSQQALDIVAKLQKAKTESKVNMPVLPTNPTESMHMLAGAITDSIREAKELGVSPEKLAPLYNSLTRALEISAELQGTLDRSTKVLNFTKIDVKKEIDEYANALLLSR